MQRQLTRRISELLMDMDDAPQAADSVVVNGQSVPESYNTGHHRVELAYLTPAEQNLLAQVDMYGSSPPHPGPAGIPNFNGGGGGGGGGDGDGDGDGDGGGDDTGVGSGGTGVGSGSGGSTGIGGAESASAGDEADVDDPGDPGPGPGDEADVDDPGLGMEGEETAVDAQAEAAAAAAANAAAASAAQAQAQQAQQAQAQADIAAANAMANPAIAQAMANHQAQLDAIAQAVANPPEPTVLATDVIANLQAQLDAIDVNAMTNPEIAQAGHPMATAAMGFSMPSSSDSSLGLEGEETAVDPVAEAEAVEAVAIAEALAMEDQVSFTSPTSVELNDGTTVEGTPSQIAAIQSMVDNASAAASQALTDNIDDTLGNQQGINAQAVAEAVNNNDITVAQAEAVMGQAISGGGQGSGSPAVGLGVNSELGLNSVQDVIDALSLNAGSPNPNIGFAINDPTGLSPESLNASRIAGNLNPSLTNAMFSLAGLIGPAGQALSMGAGALEGRGATAALGLTDSGRGSIAEAVTDFSNSVIGDSPGDPAIGDEDPGEIGGPSEEELTALLTPPTTTLPDQTPTEEEEDTADTADTADVVLPRIPSPALPPPVATPTQSFSPVNLPPVFTEQDARLLLQQTGQLPFAGIV